MAPQADPQQIRIQYTGLDNIALNNGDLELHTSVNTIMELHPLAWQMIDGEKIDVACVYHLEDNVVSFLFPAGYNPNYALTIDPATLIFASYSGSTSDNWGYSATYDAEGNLYGAGITFADGYPVTDGAFQESWGGGGGIYVADVTISKFTPDGSSLIYSTYLGGSSEDLPYSLIVDPDNNLIVFGATGSANFPVTPGCFDNTFNGGSLITVDYVLTFNAGSDAFISKFNADGTALLGSTYIGGTSNDALNDISVIAYNYGDHARSEVNIDADGNIMFATSTKSADIPVTPGAFQTGFGGVQDGFVGKLNGDLSGLLWCSYLGGSAADGAFSIKPTESNDILICGGTASSDLPTTGDALHTTFQGGTTDGYVTIVNNSGTIVKHSTYIGTNQYDQTFLSEVDADNNVYITGQTLGAYPVTAGVYSNPGSTQYITKLDSSLSNILFSTVFGNGDDAVNISPTAFLVDYCHNIYVAGWGGAVNASFNPAAGYVTGMPTTPDAYQTTTDGSDFYLIVFSENAASLEYATFFGGPISDEHVDGGTSRFDKQGVVYEAVCAGCGSNDDFPTTPGVVSNTNNSANCNLGVFKFSLTPPPTTAAFTADPLEGCTPLDVNFTNNSINAIGYAWDFGDGATDTETNPEHSYSEPGSYTITLIAFSDPDCGSNDTTSSTVTIYGYPEAAFTYTPENPSVFASVVFSDASSDASSWLWEFGDGSTSTLQDPEHFYASAGAFYVCLTVTNAAGCTDKVCDSLLIEEISLLETPNAFSPNGDGINDEFIPINYGLDAYEFRVYNRWGELLFLTNDPAKGWNGIWKGVEQELDVYVYVVSGNGVDGVHYSKQGNFTLVR
ncbi:MAG: PKD domain-containing protein [Chitinophagales bacterium]